MRPGTLSVRTVYSDGGGPFLRAEYPGDAPRDPRRRYRTVPHHRRWGGVRQAADLAVRGGRPDLHHRGRRHGRPRGAAVGGCGADDRLRDPDRARADSGDPPPGRPRRRGAGSQGRAGGRDRLGRRSLGAGPGGLGARGGTADGNGAGAGSGRDGPPSPHPGGRGDRRRPCGARAGPAAGDAAPGGPGRLHGPAGGADRHQRPDAPGSRDLHRRGAPTRRGAAGRGERGPRRCGQVDASGAGRAPRDVPGRQSPRAPGGDAALRPVGREGPARGAGPPDAWRLPGRSRGGGPGRRAGDRAVDGRAG